MIRPDVRVQDPLALAEIELYGELVIAATGSDGPLTQREIDAVLGIESRSSTAVPAAGAIALTAVADASRVRHSA